MKSVETRDEFVLFGSCRFLSSAQVISSHLISFLFLFSPAKSTKHWENSASTERHYGGRGAQAHGVSRVADQRS